MLRFQRPPTPDDFEEYVASAREKIEQLAKAAPPKSKDFDAKWGKYKPDFLAALFNKCGYCEQKLGSFFGDIDHYRPKAALQKLPANKKLWGREGKGDKNSFDVKDRKLIDLEGPGYWWLAYTWSNYLAACNRCNSGWKKSLFPVAENPRPLPLKKGQEKTETPLLLNPFEKEDPAHHLAFDRQGMIKPKDDSSYGRATIDTCGLDRPSLVDSRLEKAKRAHHLVQKYYKVQEEYYMVQEDGKKKEKEEKTKKTLRDFIEIGDESYVHAGMVRTIFHQEIGLPWDKVASWAKSPA